MSLMPQPDNVIPPQMKPFLKLSAEKLFSADVHLCLKSCLMIVTIRDVRGKKIDQASWFFRKFN
jgi:hypothetical protein